MQLQHIGGEFSICRVGDLRRVDLSRPFLFIGRTDEELSVVCPTESAPKDALARDDGWRAFRVAGTLDLSLTGVLARLSATLAGAGVGIFAVSTYNTDYILVKRGQLPRAVDALTAAGHTFL